MFRVATFLMLFLGGSYAFSAGCCECARPGVEEVEASCSACFGSDTAGTPTQSARSDDTSPAADGLTPKSSCECCEKEEAPYDRYVAIAPGDRIPVEPSLRVLKTLSAQPEYARHPKPILRFEESHPPPPGEKRSLLQVRLL